MTTENNPGTTCNIILSKEQLHVLPQNQVKIRSSYLSLTLPQEKKEEIWLSPMTKAPTPTEMSKGQSDNTNNATKKFD